ncbi:hypothetical protein KFK09_015348 [Dendrobium nobile]|uniref:Uncharacterized protein n=1 Tax=Dendrobium nobile TaxID=94219 RepID=A0A8T3BA97_DENNO|nr:hypothetical protein KFK09_015348 [Dendrobium nobile]
MPHPVFAALTCARISSVLPVFSAGGATFFRHGRLLCRRSISAEASDGIGAPAAGERIVDGDSGAGADGERNQTSSEAQSRGPLLSVSSIPVVKKDIKKVINSRHHFLCLRVFPVFVGAWIFITLDFLNLGIGSFPAADLEVPSCFLEVKGRMSIGIYLFIVLPLLMLSQVYFFW